AGSRGGAGALLEVRGAESWWPREIEGAGERRRLGIAIGQRLEPVEVLDEPQHRGEFVDGGIDRAAGRVLAGARVRGDDQCGRARTEAHDVVVRRLHMVVEPAEVVPDDHDGRARPRIALEDRVQVLDGPVLTLADADACARILALL